MSEIPSAVKVFEQNSVNAIHRNFWGQSVILIIIKHLIPWSKAENPIKSRQPKPMDL